jgi:hypothetical protein
MSKTTGEIFELFEQEFPQIIISRPALQPIMDYYFNYKFAPSRQDKKLLTVGILKYIMEQLKSADLLAAGEDAAYNYMAFKDNYNGDKIITTIYAIVKLLNLDSVRQFTKGWNSVATDFPSVPKLQ